MTANELLASFKALTPWTATRYTVDRIVRGNGEKEVKSALISWMGSNKVLQRAKELNVDLLLVHEPFVWTHFDESNPNIIGFQRATEAASKFRILDESGIVLMRIHDIWDTYPSEGVPWALANYLGFYQEVFPEAHTIKEMNEHPIWNNEPIGAEHYHHCYKIDLTSVSLIAKQIAEKTFPLGQCGVQVVGNHGQLIQKIGIGAGCYCRPEIFQIMGCDAAIVCDDGAKYWSDLSWAIDNKYPLFRISHGVAEEPGIQNLYLYCKKHFLNISFFFEPLDLQWQQIF